MRQIIIDFGTLDLFGMHLSLRIFGYGLMMVLGFLSAISIARWRARRMGESPDVMTQIGILSLIGGVLGARLAYVIQHWDTQFASAEARSLGNILNITSGGLIYYGGLVLASLTVMGFLLIKRLPIRRHLDIVAVSMMVGLAFGRAGCLLNGCCYGGPCGHEWALGTEFPVYSEPLVKFDGHENPYSQGTDGPSPVYHHQLRKRAEAFHKDGAADSPARLRSEKMLDERGQPVPKAADGRISPPLRLVHFVATDRATIEKNGKEIGIPMVRVHPPRELHGRLDRDQMAVVMRDEAQARPLFDALAGADGRLTHDEWQRGLTAGDGLLAGSEHWTEALSADRPTQPSADRPAQTPRDGMLNFSEFQAYSTERKEMLLDLFDDDGDGDLAGAEIDRANAYLQADEIALAGETHSLPVKPAQALGIINALLLAGLLSLFYRLRKREGQVFALLLVLYPITRFMLEAIRDDNPHNLLEGVLTHNQYTSLAMTAAGIVLWILLRRMPASCGPAWAQRLAAKQTAAK